jgi:hypothetical protein
MTRIGIIGAGHIGSTLARGLVDRGYDVVISNSRGPESLAPLVAELGDKATAGTATDAATLGDVVIVTVPLKAYQDVPVAPLAGKIVLDTNNYYWERDGRIPALEEKRATTSGLLQDHLPESKVAKAFNHIMSGEIRPARPRDRRRRRRGSRLRDGPLRRVRLRHCERRPSRGELARGARPAGVRDPADPRRVGAERREGHALTRRAHFPHGCGGAAG